MMFKIYQLIIDRYITVQYVKREAQDERYVNVLNTFK